MILKPGDYPKFPPGYGDPSRQDWQRKTMESFRSSWLKRLRRWWKGER